MLKLSTSSPRSWKIFNRTKRYNSANALRSVKKLRFPNNSVIGRSITTRGANWADCAVGLGRIYKKLWGDEENRRICSFLVGRGFKLREKSRAAWLKRFQIKSVAYNERYYVLLEAVVRSNCLWLSRKKYWSLSNFLIHIQVWNKKSKIYRDRNNADWYLIFIYRVFAPAYLLIWLCYFQNFCF